MSQFHLLPPSGWFDPKLEEAARDVADTHQIVFILGDNSESLINQMRSAEDTFAGRGRDGRVVVLSRWGTSPPKVLADRNYTIEAPSDHWRVLGLPESPPQDGWREWLHTKLTDWLDDPGTEPAYTVGSLVSGPVRDDAEQFVIGTSEEIVTLLDDIDRVKRRYRQLIGSKVGSRREEVHSALHEFLALDARKSEEPGKRQELFTAVTKALEATRGGAVPISFQDADPGALPRILVRGESGAGKTFLTRYLSRRSSPDDAGLYRPIRRIPIPSYLGDEERLEFDMFGYLRGAFTGALESGSPGTLLGNIGGVIFLDEIGDASPSLQAKLLAFLDDYRVTPKGWHGEGIFCPVLIVAATNKPIERWAEADEKGVRDEHFPPFRHDLLRRFNKIIHLPGLNGRREDIPYLVDVLLQSEAVNPGRQVTGLTEEVMTHLTNHDYANGNFRYLSDLLRDACTRATCRRKKIIRLPDLPSC